MRRGEIQRAAGMAIKTSAGNFFEDFTVGQRIFHVRKELARAALL